MYSGPHAFEERFAASNVKSGVLRIAFTSSALFRVMREVWKFTMLLMKSSFRIAFWISFHELESSPSRQHTAWIVSCTLIGGLIMARISFSCALLICFTLFFASSSSGSTWFSSWFTRALFSAISPYCTFSCSASFIEVSWFFVASSFFSTICFSFSCAASFAASSSTRFCDTCSRSTRTCSSVSCSLPRPTWRCRCWSSSSSCLRWNSDR